MSGIKKKTTIQAMVDGALTELMVKTVADNVYLDDNTTVATKIAELSSNSDTELSDRIAEIELNLGVTNTDLEAANYNIDRILDGTFTVGDSEKLGGVSSSHYLLISTDLAIDPDEWILDESLNLYKAIVSWSGLTANHKVDVCLDLESLDLAVGMKNYTESEVGCFYLYSSDVITSTLTGKAYARMVNA